MEGTDVCNLVYAKLEDMWASGKINTDIIENIRSATEECRDRERFWLSKADVSPQMAFVLYHAARNSRLILEKMQDRFVHAPELHDNPRVVDDALAVFPRLSEMCDMVDSLKNVRVTTEMLGFVRRRVRSLRNIAQKASMLPTTKEEIEAVDRNELLEELGGIADTFKVSPI
jgi:hypothetical protein